MKIAGLFIALLLTLSAPAFGVIDAKLDVVDPRGILNPPEMYLGDVFNLYVHVSGQCVPPNATGSWNAAQASIHWDPTKLERVTNLPVFDETAYKVWKLEGCGTVLLAAAGYRPPGQSSGIYSMQGVMWCISDPPDMRYVTHCKAPSGYIFGMRFRAIREGSVTIQLKGEDIQGTQVGVPPYDKLYLVKGVYTQEVGTSSEVKFDIKGEFRPQQTLCGSQE